MKTGIIVYVVGEENWTVEPEEAVRELNINADRVEVVTSGSSNFDIMDAWWKLTVKGMNKIVCLIAEFTRNSTKLELTGRELRLCG